MKSKKPVRHGLSVAGMMAGLAITTGFASSCTEIVECEEASDCKKGERCDDGLCAGGKSSSGGGSTPGSVAPGDPCVSDGECATGSRCLDSLLPGDPRYCAPRCTTHDECAVFFQASSFYQIPIPADLQPGNAWNATVLDRVLAGCVDLAERPTMGAPDGFSYCGYVCPLNSGAVWDDNGAVTACRCLPNYSDVDPAADRKSCVWDDNIECSMFRAECNAANTEVQECSQGNFTCLVNEALYGQCVDWVTSADIEACVYEQCGTSNCDVNCLTSCGGTPACVDACCTCAG